MDGQTFSKTERRIFVRNRERARAPPRVRSSTASGGCVCAVGRWRGGENAARHRRPRFSGPVPNIAPSARKARRYPRPNRSGRPISNRPSAWRGERRAGSRPAGLLAAATGRAQRPCRVLFLTRRAGGPAACAGYGDRAARSDGTAESAVASPFSVTKHGTGVLPPSRRCADSLFSSSAHVSAAAIPDAASAIALFRT